MIGIVIGHKSLAFELIVTAEAILGQTEDLYAFSNEKISTEEGVTEIKNLLASRGNPENVIFMVDLRGGNCWAIARMTAHSHAGYYVVSGVNLPMILSFLTKKSTSSVTDLVQSMENDAHRGIMIEQ